MELLDNQPSGGIFNYFQGATIYNLVINGTMNRSGSEHYASSPDEAPRPSPMLIARALMAVNGTGHVVDNQRAWLGACLLLGWKYGFSRNLSECCQQIRQLPIDWTQVQVPLKYGSIREFAYYKFTKERYEQWPTLTPRSEERAVFEKSFAVAQALDSEIQRELKEKQK
jgi:hypothetical protein